MSIQYERRGTIQFRERAKQLIDYSCLRYGNITPTDIDGLVEYKDKAYVFIEIKYENAEMPKGQRIAIERLINDLSKCGKPVAGFLCEHYISDCEEDVDAAKAIVRSLYFNSTWYPDGKRTLKAAMDSYIRFVNDNIRKVEKR